MIDALAVAVLSLVFGGTLAGAAWVALLTGKEAYASFLRWRAGLPLPGADRIVFQRSF